MTTQSADSHHVLITGGTQGIGRGLATRLLARGDAVLVTGRSTERLDALAAEHPGIQTVRSDIGIAEDRVALAAHVRQAMPQLDLVINNAGIQRRVGLAQDDAEWSERQAEIDTLLSGPVHLNHLLIPLLLAQDRPVRIVNVSSGGALVPQPFAPLYSAGKAALHSYTVTLRHALRETSCRVIELIPPAVATGLAGDGDAHGADLDAFCDAVLPALVSGDADTVAYGMTDSPQIRRLLDDEAGLFKELAGRFEVPAYRCP